MGAKRGFSLLELLIVIVIISVLVVIAVERLLTLRYEAERAMVQSVVGAMRSGLYMEFAGAAASGKLKRVDAAAGSNPMLRLAERPDTYAGEFFGADPALFEPGTWYFDTRDRAVVYIVRFPEQFSSPLPGTPRLRLAVQPDYDPGSDSARGLKLEPLEPYHWKAVRGKQGG